MTYIILQSERTRETLLKCLKPVSDMHLSLSSLMILEGEPGNHSTFQLILRMTYPSHHLTCFEMALNSDQPFLCSQQWFMIHDRSPFPDEFDYNHSI